MVKLNYWMQALKGTRKLVDLCLPGSHDAGVYNDEERGVTVGDSARCQYNNIGEQASCGSRVFDIRCFLKTSGVFNKTKTPTMGHFFADKPPFGEYGGTLESALNDALNFVKISPSEFLGVQSEVALPWRTGAVRIWQRISERMIMPSPVVHKGNSVQIRHSRLARRLRGSISGG
jgi:hypothetical protein